MEVCSPGSYWLDAHFHRKAVNGSLSNWKNSVKGTFIWAVFYNVLIKVLMLRMVVIAWIY